MKNIHKRKNLMGIIYAVIMLIPLLSVLVRTCYVTFNKNAFQSYSDTYVDSVQIVTGSNMLISNNDYLINPKTFYDYNETYVNAGKIKYNTISVNWNDILPSNQQLTPQELETVNGFVFYKGGSSDKRLNLYNDETLIISFVTTTQFQLRNLDQTIYFNFNTSMNWSIGSYQLSFNSSSLKTIILQKDTLDNAFEYSIKRVTDNSNIGRLNLINWFVDIFLDSTNSTNALYLNFINWYLNYTLLVSCMYLLYLVLMWFINLARRILSKGFNEEI